MRGSSGRLESLMVIPLLLAATALYNRRSSCSVRRRSPSPSLDISAVYLALPSSVGPLIVTAYPPSPKALSRVAARMPPLSVLTPASAAPQQVSPIPYLSLLPSSKQEFRNYVDRARSSYERFSII